MVRLVRGHHVRVRHVDNEEWLRAMVVLASPGGTSVILMFDGAIRAGNGLLAGTLPLTIDYEAQTVRGVMTDDLYEIKVAG